MSFRPWRPMLCPLSCLLACSGGSGPSEAEPEPGTVVVLVVTEGLSAEVAAPLRTKLDGGLARLGGPALVASVSHPHQTLTPCPGHATLATGAAPSAHGVPADQWWLQEGEAPVDCWAEDSLLAGTLADEVRQAGSRAVVIGHAPAAGTLHTGESTTTTVWLEDGAWRSGWQGVPSWAVDVPAADPSGVGLAALAAVEELELGSSGMNDLLVITSGRTRTAPEAGLKALDVAMAPLARALDERVGADHWSLVLTSTHGVARPAEPVDAEIVLETARASLSVVHADGEVHFAPPDLYLPAEVRKISSTKEAVQLEFRTRLHRTHPEWSALAWNDSDGMSAEDPRLAQVERGTYGLRSGDLLVFPAPGTYFATATDHGERQAQVPLWACGPAVVPMVMTDAMDSRDVAPTLAAWLGVDAPSKSEGTAVLQ